MGILFGKKKIQKSKVLSILAIRNTVVGKTALVKCYESICENNQKKELEKKV